MREVWSSLVMVQGRVGLDARAARSLQNSAMHLRKARHPHSMQLPVLHRLVCIAEPLCACMGLELTEFVHRHLLADMCTCSATVYFGSGICIAAITG